MALICLWAVLPLWADEGMWVLKELNKQNRARIQELGFLRPMEILSSDTQASLSDAVVIFGGGCTGISVSEQGLLFTNHHCGYSAIQQLSSVEHDYLKNGFVAQSQAEELPVPGLTVCYLRETVDVSERLNSQLAQIEDEYTRLMTADSLGQALCDSVETNAFVQAEVLPFYNYNKYYLLVYDVFRDVRMAFAPPSSMGKFGGDTDNWMWPRHTCDFSVFRVYANAENKPAEYAADNKPYHPRYVAEVSLQGYAEGDYAMTMGYPGSTERYLCSWGVRQMMECDNKPTIEVRGVKQALWKEAMQASDAVRIKYASKYAGSSNYWKNAIGMNKGLTRLGVIARKQAEELAFADWMAKDQARMTRYGEVLHWLERGYTATNKQMEAQTYLIEAFMSGAEILRLARMLQNFDTKGSTAEEKAIFLQDKVKPFFKNYEAQLDQRVLAAMLQLVKQRVPSAYLPDCYAQIDKKYKGDYARYAADLFKKTCLLDYAKVEQMLYDKKAYGKFMKDPAAVLSLSVTLALYDLQHQVAEPSYQVLKGDRLYFQALREMYPDRSFYADANHTLRLSYGKIGGYRPYDAAWYDYFTTEKGILEKADPENEEFDVQPEILDLMRGRDFGSYANAKGDLQLCFLTNNDITGGNSGSPVFDKQARLIGLAFDGNWEAMSGDIAFEPELQRCIAVDIRFVLFMIEKWGHCPRLIDELKLVR